MGRWLGKAGHGSIRNSNHNEMVSGAGLRQLAKLQGHESVGFQKWGRMRHACRMDGEITK